MNQQYAILADRTFTPEGIRYQQYVVINDGIVQEVTNIAPENCPIIHLKDRSLLPGFVDIHIHGRAGCDVMDASQSALQTISDELVQTGVVAWVGTTVTAPMDDIQQALTSIRDFTSKPQTSGAQLLGSFLEGPYFTERHRGSHPVKYLKAPTVAELDELYRCAEGSLLRVAIAPEAEGATSAIDWLVEHKIKTSVAHTAADYEQTSQAFARGADCGVHLYNGMTGLHHREPGCCGAVLYHNVLAELIADGIHVHPVMMELAYRLKGYQQIALITDCMRAGGLPDGDYALGAQMVKATNGQARTVDGSLAGSTCSLDSALRNMVRLAHIPEWEAVQMATAIPAEYLGISEQFGYIRKGAQANFAVVDNNFYLTDTFIRGEHVHSVFGKADH
ncbi:N-acetylglucosamine-6-phosphate deacetylase [Providencia rettgeri]|nr:N-acetylglucosamine-6-phosphate deacetylase [Providencia rettgeri]ELQ1456782.1 N-acetylglucosamine-6-phosphate deacetylase [Providencia rettgeri]ELR5188051.1 N-acetylglucosamine-6-phosphate deacetylase [Providencia rettgeri]EMB0750821.1 N-acetylglucosamine-6-phosphate deacetylase [Providencia rettgeri]EMB0753698.1 N-acetylglucosamine-6-phosphate deacetylase [Providencia rettgeri]